MTARSFRFQRAPAALLVCALATLPGCSNEARSSAQAQAGSSVQATSTRVRVVQPEPVRHRPTFRISGTLRPLRDAPLGFKVGGTLQRILVQRGQTVTQRQPLLALDDREVQAGAAQTRAAVAAAEAQAALAQDAVDRVAQLVQSGTVTPQQATQTRLQLQAAQAQVAQARAALAGVVLQIEHHTLRAPFDGTVLLAPDAVGVVVGPGTPLVQVTDLNCLSLQTGAPPEAAGLLAVGTPLLLERRDGQTLGGTLERILPALDARSHRLPVEVQACGPTTAGWANHFVEVVLPGQEELPAARLPDTVFPRVDDPRLFLVAPDGLVALRPVTILERRTGWTVVRGLAGGEQVVDLPSPDLREGQRVTVEPVVAPPGAAASEPAAGDVTTPLPHPDAGR